VARRRSRPRQIAHDLLVRIGARSPEQIDPILTAKALGIEVAFGDLAGATARIFRIGATARIRVSDQIRTEGRRRVSIAHEIGHFALNHELPSEANTGSWLKASCAHRNKRDERDADILAVEHLTPEPMVSQFCKRAPVDLHAVREIERVFVASPVMSAMRLVELSPEPCAVVYSERAIVKWMKPSRSFPGFLTGGMHLAPESVAFGYFDRGALVDVPTRLRARAWLGMNRHITAGTEIVEHAMVIPEPGWGGVLSLLWLPHWTKARAST
jgi:hypothetical protein